MPDPQTVYLDDQGNPLRSGTAPVYLDENGNPVKGDARQRGDQYKGPDTFTGGFIRSLGDTIERTKAGTYRGAAMAVPRLAMAVLNAPQTIANAAGIIVHPIQAAKDMGLAASNPDTGGEMIGNLLIGSALPEAARAAQDVPVGRLLSSAWGGIKGGLSKTPILGKMMGGAAEGAQRAWQEGSSAASVEPPPIPSGMDAMQAIHTASGGKIGATQAVEATRLIRQGLTPSEALQQVGFRQLQPTAAAPPPISPPTAVPAIEAPQPIKPHLSATDVPKYLRNEYGSEAAGRMLYGKSGVGLPRAEATANIKRLAPGASKLPNAAERAIRQGVQQGSPTEAWNYVQAAPNNFVRELLIKLMRGE